MARHRFGDGRYRYFDHPLPEAIAELRGAFYGRLAPIANRWSGLLGGATDAFPLAHEDLLARCRAAGQERPTPLLLRYGAGDWNALHQDLYGDVYFPFQVLSVLSEPGTDYEGGEFVLMEQRPRAQSRAHVITPPRGAFVIFPTQVRPNAGKRGHHRVGLRHGVSTVTVGPAHRAGDHLPRRALSRGKVIKDVILALALALGRMLISTTSSTGPAAARPRKTKTKKISLKRSRRR